ncbi:MAG TPA: LLM class F420-dependent oxidoreductase [Actinomycetota bacterium]|jgi:F420-dependent oxidoreductase-like protein
MIERARQPLTRLGLQIPSFTYPGVTGGQLFDRIVDIATTGERSGFDSIWVMDHFFQIRGVGAPDEPMFEAYTLLAGIAARTSTARLGAMVTGVTYRNPAFLAKVVTNLDVISAGRAVLGIGAAWNEDESRAYGWDFPPVRERFERLEEALQICRAMFTKASPSFEGKHYRIEEALNEPRPVQTDGPPILIGGGGERKTLRLVARYGDACNFFGDASTVRHKLDVLERHCEEVRRDPAEITKTRLGSLIVAPTHEEAERRAVEVRQARRMSDEWFRAGTTVGDPDEVAEGARALLDAGLDGLLFNVWPAGDVEAVALAGETLSKVVA